MDEKGLGRLLQAARVKAGLTQQALCQKAGLSYSTLTKIERGAIKSPSIFTVYSITSAIGVSIDELMGAAGLAGQKHRAQSASGVSFVYFDINGCLVRLYHRALAQLAEEHDIPLDIVETTYWRYNDEACRGETTMAAFDQAFAKMLGVKQFNWIHYYLRSIEPIQQMHELVRWASQHYGVGLLTNIMPGFIDAMRVQAMLPNVAYDAVIDSSKVGAIKPESKIYELAAQKAQCSPSEILLVDDTKVNLAAASKQGWHVLWFDESRLDESIARIKSALEP